MEAREFRPAEQSEGTFDRALSFAPYFCAGIGIAVLLLIGLGLLLMVLLMTVAPPGLGEAIPELSEGVVAALFLVGAVLGGFWFMRRRMRSVAERRLVIDGEGITYCTAARGCRSLRWDEIESAVEDGSGGVADNTYTLTIRGGGRRLRFADSDLAGYGAIRALLRGRIPERVRLQPDYD